MKNAFKKIGLFIGGFFTALFFYLWRNILQNNRTANDGIKRNTEQLSDTSERLSNTTKQLGTNTERFGSIIEEIEKTKFEE